MTLDSVNWKAGSPNALLLNQGQFPDQRLYPFQDRQHFGPCRKGILRPRWHKIPQAILLGGEIVLGGQ